MSSETPAGAADTTASGSTQRQAREQGLLLPRSPGELADGVLEVRMPAPAPRAGARRIEVERG